MGLCLAYLVYAFFAGLFLDHQRTFAIIGIIIGFLGYAPLITDAIFWAGGTAASIGQALSNTLSKIIDAVYDHTNPFNWQRHDPLDLSTFDLLPGSDDVDGVAATYANLRCSSPRRSSRSRYKPGSLGPGVACTGRTSRSPLRRLQLRSPHRRDTTCRSPLSCCRRRSRSPEQAGAATGAGGSGRVAVERRGAVA